VQHRFAGLAHEGAHYLLMRNRLANELISDLFCMFPLFSTTAQYRVIHFGHHEYTNDWERDPELLNLGDTRKMDQFPMTRWEFFKLFVLRILWPPALFSYVLRNFYVTTLGHGVHPYIKRRKTPPSPTLLGLRVTTILGVAYIGVMVAVMGYLSWFGSWASLIAAPMLLWGGASLIAMAIPEHWYYQSDFRPIYSSRLTSVMRMGSITLLECILAWGRFATGVEWGVDFWLFWALPLFTTFPYYMLLRDLFQHANADEGKLTNSRVIFCDPITRWAMFIYGQDAHLTHHLYPGVPHYNLPKTHQVLMENSPEYAAHVVECHGVLSNSVGKPTCLDVMEMPTRESVLAGSGSDEGGHT
jgi:fatty acid desaturase